MRKAASYACPFCSYTGEKKTTAQMHLLVNHLDDLLRLAHRKRIRVKYNARRGGIVPTLRRS